MQFPRVWFERNRPRLARLVLVGALAAIGMTVWDEVPHETRLEYGLGPRHAEVIELRVAYLRDGDSFYGARFHFPTGAPRHVRHTVSLPRGRFQVQLDMVKRGGVTSRATRALLTPAEGLVKLRAVDPGARAL